MLKWKGEELKEKLDKAIPWAINSIMADCIRDAKAAVPKKTTTLQGSIRMEIARKIAGIWTGIWGSFNVLYAIMVEKGTKPHMIFPKTKKALYWEGADHPVKSVNHPGTTAKPFLVPAANKNYPRLNAKIREGLESL